MTKFICEDDDYQDYDDYDDDDDYDDYADWITSEETLTTSFFGDLLISEVVKQDLEPPDCHQTTKLMYVLKTQCMLIADIDCGDDIYEPLNRLSNFAIASNSTFNVYKTRNGMRYLQTNLMYQNANRSAIATLKALGSDPKYINFCDSGKHFMARLTPKIEPELALKYYRARCEGKPTDIAICHFLKIVNKKKDCVSGGLMGTILIHDHFTQCHQTDLKLF